MRTSPEEGIKRHRFAGILPEQFLTEAGRHREAVVAADQRIVIRCFSDDLAGFVHDVSHVRHKLSVLNAVAKWKQDVGELGDQNDTNGSRSPAASMMEARFGSNANFGRSRATALIWMPFWHLLKTTNSVASSSYVRENGTICHYWCVSGALAS